MKGISEKVKGLLLIIIFIALLFISTIGAVIFLTVFGAYEIYKKRKKKK